MAKRQVQCAHCDRTFEIDEEFAVESVNCPSCGARIAVLPPVDMDLGSRQKLALKKDGVISGNLKRCPLCNSSADQDAVICVTCGYD
ncbi:MAG: hypothetical protein JXB04_02475, partial [Kiritimatiellae bacterium]|nr:hypothetical protein [Kiritimatiellia bacterium]